MPPADPVILSLAKRKLRDAVIELLKVGGYYVDIEDEVTEAYLIACNESVYCDIHG